jgi:hypothetical protein
MNVPNQQDIIVQALDASLNENLVELTQRAPRQIYLRMNDDTGALIVDANLGNFTFTAGIEYEIEVQWDLVSGDSRVRIDGIQHGPTIANTGVRTTVNFFKAGSAVNATDFQIRDFLVFDQAQHVSDYTPGEPIPQTKYAEDLIAIPQFVNTVGTITMFDAWIETQVGPIRASLNGFYWNGAGWVASDDSYAQMNDPVDINSNIGSLPVSNTLDIKLRTTNSNTQETYDNLVVEYTKTLFAITDPPVTYDSANFSITAPFFVVMTAFVETSTKLGSDEIKYTISTDGGVSFLYYNVGWIPSDGTYANSNTAAEINANLFQFPESESITIRFFLHSETGTTTPELDQLDIDYNENFYSTDSPSIRTASGIAAQSIQGFFPDENTPVDTQVTYIIKDGAIDKWFDGEKWTNSDGTVAQSNSGLTIDQNRVGLNLVNPFTITAFLGTTNNQETPAV